MSDDRPTAGGNGAGDQDIVIDGRAAGRCMKCRTILPLEDALPQIGTGHLVHATGGDTCGPVARAIYFHVVAHVNIGPTIRVVRAKMPTLEAPEENYDLVLPAWEKAIQALFRKVDEKGNPIIGAAPPPVVISIWKQIEVRL